MVLEQGSLFADRYVLSKLLGKGGFSQVWLAQDSKSGIDVALKVYAPYGGLDDKGTDMFSKEFSLVFNVNHTNILTPTYFDIYENSPYLIMPFCGNGGANSLIGRSTAEELLHILHDVAAGLAHLHSQTPPIIHQDIKPDNILLNDHGDFVITDFGISTKARSTLRKSAMTDESSGGTYGYMGPERFSKNPAPVKASDIWSLGAMAFELLEGNTPYDNIGGAMQKNGAEIPEIKADIPEDLKKLVYSCLAKETWDRPSALEIVEITDKMLRGEDIPEKMLHGEEPKGVPDDIKKTIIQSPEVLDGRKTILVSNDGPSVGKGTRRLDGQGSQTLVRKYWKFIVPAVLACLVIAAFFIFSPEKHDIPEEPAPSAYNDRIAHIRDSLINVILDDSDVNGGYTDSLSGVSVYTAGYLISQAKELLNDTSKFVAGKVLLERVVEKQYKSSAEAAAILSYMYAIRNAGSNPDAEYLSLINPTALKSLPVDPQKSVYYSDLALSLDPGCYQARFEKCMDFIGGPHRGQESRRLTELKSMFESGMKDASDASDEIYIGLFTRFKEKYNEAIYGF